MNVKCKDYCGTACLDGTCPIANKDEYIERGIELPKTCSDCIYNLSCVDCIYYSTDICPHELF